MNLYKLHSKPETLDLHDQAFEKMPALIWEKYRNQPVELKKREKALAKEPKTACGYAFHVLRKPFPAGEFAIAKDAFYAYHYARNVLKGPFPAGEAVIARDPLTAYCYALYILGLREATARKWGEELRNCSKYQAARSLS